MKLNEAIILDWIDPRNNRTYAGYTVRQAVTMTSPILKPIRVGGEELITLKYPIQWPATDADEVVSIYGHLHAIIRERDSVLRITTDAENTLTRLTREQMKLAKLMRRAYTAMDKSNMSMKADMDIEGIISAAEIGLLTFIES